MSTLSPEQVATELQNAHTNMRDYLVPFLANHSVTMEEKRKALEGHMTILDRLQRALMVLCVHLEQLPQPPSSLQTWAQILAALQQIKDRFGIQRNFSDEGAFDARCAHITPLLDALARAMRGL
ncbi:hypothetical protein BXZ70DRAFT_1010987 [Cristinia sonorae]|uniref:Uncharacterized protein n=1 Tax=Cristinia sonorae TaxID=1940300 RepID=A0A8K0XLU6_9AGAR|nr:hypothetical protein BXZ70DRAFT_1010987 [Cristinia sonorae]